MKRFWLALIIYILFFTPQINDFLRNQTDISAYTGTPSRMQDSEVFFKIKWIYFRILRSYKYIILIMKINNFQGYLSDISAETATLHCRSRRSCCVTRPLRRLTRLPRLRSWIPWRRWNRAARRSLSPTAFPQQLSVTRSLCSRAGVW